MNVSIGKNLEKYIELQLKDGPFNSASEIVRDALRMHQLKYAEIHQQNLQQIQPIQADLDKWDKELEEDGDNASKSRSVKRGRKAR